MTQTLKGPGAVVRSEALECVQLGGNEHLENNPSAVRVQHGSRATGPNLRLIALHVRAAASCVSAKANRNLVHMASALERRAGGAR